MDDAIAARQERISWLEMRIAELEVDRKRLADILAIRALGLSMYGVITPPKEIDEPTDPQEQEKRIQDMNEPPAVEVPSDLKDLVSRHGPRARHLVSAIEKRNLSQVAQNTQEAERLLDLARQVGREAAESTLVSGNGHK